MKKILILVFALAFSVAQAQTFSVQNLSVAGSTTLTSPLTVANGGTGAATASGTALDNIAGFAGTGFITRTGAGTYAFQSATNGITLGNLVQSAANTVLANGTGSTANVTAFAMPSCSTSASALIWTAGTGFTCNTSIAAASVSGTVAIANGGTGQVTQGAAFTAILGSSLVPIANGGTNAATAASNLVFAGPSSGSAAAPSFRSLVANDIPWPNSTTVGRPTPTVIGQMDFDTTLNQPVWCKQVTPSVIWVNSAGVAQ